MIRLSSTVYLLYSVLVAVLYYYARTTTRLTISQYIVWEWPCSVLPVIIRFVVVIVGLIVEIVVIVELVEFIVVGIVELVRFII